MSFYFASHPTRGVENSKFAWGINLLMFSILNENLLIVTNKIGLYLIYIAINSGARVSFIVAATQELVSTPSYIFVTAI